MRCFKRIFFTLNAQIMSIKCVENVTYNAMLDESDISDEVVQKRQRDKKACWQKMSCDNLPYTVCNKPVAGTLQEGQQRCPKEQF